MEAHSHRIRIRITRCTLLAAGMFLLTAGLPAQVLMRGTDPSGVVLIHPGDRAVFEAGVERDDLPCSVEPNKPILGFDLRFHVYYEIAIPLNSLSGDGNDLTILVRVTGEERPSEPVYFMQRVRVPEVEDRARGEAYLQGGFDVGEGDYSVALLMRDRAGRVCSHFWDARAELPNRDRDIALVIEPYRITEGEVEQFREEPPVPRDIGPESLHLKILVNFAPQNLRSATLQPYDTSALVSILRTISRDPRIERFSIVAFNLQEQRILHRQDNVERIDFRALGNSLDTLNLGTIDLERLSDRHGETRFLTDLMSRELGTIGDADALVFAGPKAMLDRNVSEEELRALGQVDVPVFYMNYNLFPQRVPWRDTIGEAVRFLRGTEYTISQPRDLWYSVSRMVDEILETKQNRQVSRVGVVE